MTNSAIFLLILSVILIIAILALLTYICCVEIGKWQERRRMRQMQKDIQKEFNNAYNAMIDEAWRCSNQNNRWW